MSLTDCLSTLIGLSKTDCACFDSGKPVGANTSDSGYYLTDPVDGIPMKFIDAASDCEEGGSWEMLQNARTAAVTEFITDLNAAIGKYHKPKKRTFKGFIGDANENTTFSTSKDFVGLRFQPYSFKGGIQQFLSVSLNIDTNASVTVYLYKSTDLTTAVTSATVSAVANTWVNVDFDSQEIIDLSSPFCENTYWYVVYELPAGAKPANNTMHCGCGSINARSDRWPYLAFVDAVGVQADSYATLSSAKTDGKYTMGLRVEMVYTCSYDNWLCNLDYTHFNADDLQWQVAKTLQWAGIMYLGTLIINSDNINRLTILGKPKVYGKRSHAEKEYQNAINYIAKNIPMDKLDCFECKDGKIFKGPLITTG